MKQIIESDCRLKGIIRDISEVAGILWERGWAERNAGNISVNISEYLSDSNIRPDNYPYRDLQDNYISLGEQWFLITITGGRMRDLARRPEENILIIKVEDSGRGYFVISEANNKKTIMPTSELPTHLKIHKMIKERGSNQKVVVHTHASELIALTQVKEYCNENKLNNILWGMHPETIVFVPKGIGFVNFKTPGTGSIAEATLIALADHDIAIWEKHGVFSIGTDIIETFDAIDILAKSARIFFMCKNAGLEPEGLSDSQLEELRKIDF